MTRDANVSFLGTEAADAAECGCWKLHDSVT